VTRDLCWLVHRYESVASTMDVANQLAKFGARDRTVVVSAEQTAGRGRGGRPWRSPAGTALYCTVILRPSVAPDRLSTLPLVVGVAVAEAIERTCRAGARLKWPNDVWLGTDPGKAKVAGILVASTIHGSTVSFALIGVGINVLSGTEDLPRGATSIQAATGVASTPDDVFDALLDRFDSVYSDFLATAGRPSLAGWRARAALLGEVVSVEDAGRSITGTFVDIDEDGGLMILEPGNTIRKVVAGDLVRGPRVIPQFG
jgi:BirA family biotin operon repressor/biotin-[acetyl-CoA-carboxylase] ligase